MVSASTVVRRGAPISLCVLSVFSLVVAIIASVLVHDYNAKDDAKHPGRGIKARVRLFLFTGWFTFLFATAYVVCFLAGVGGVFTSIVSHFVFIFIDWAFWLSASASLTQSLHGGINCSYNDTGIKYCSANNALIAFGWINFILTTFMLAVVGVIAAGAFRGGGIKETFNSRA